MQKKITNLKAKISLSKPSCIWQKLLVCADDANLLGDNIDTVKKNVKTLIDAGKEVDKEVNSEKIKYVLLSRRQNAGQNH